MKTLCLALLCLFTATVNLQAAEYIYPTKRKQHTSCDHYILSEPYLTGLQQESEENLKILDELHETVELGTLPELNELLRKHPSECERFLGKYQEKPTRSPVLHKAVVRGNKGIVRALLAHNADTNLPDETDIGNNNTPLYYAAQLNRPNRLPICQILIALSTRIVNVDIKNKQGKTPLHRACESFDDPHVVKLFIYRGADIHAQTLQGQTPLHLAAANGHFENVKLLIRCGARYQDTDYSNRTPMRIAQEKVAQYPNNLAYRNILTYLKDTDTFDAFVEDLFNFDKPAIVTYLYNSQEPANKRRKISFSE